MGGIEIDRVQDVIKLIKSVLNKHMEVDDKASKDLFEIRKQLKSSKIEIDKNFNRVLRQYKKEDVLDSTEETFLDNRRLVVVSAHKKKSMGKSMELVEKGI